MGERPSARRVEQVQILRRDGDGPEALYGNTVESAVFLDKESPQYIGGILEMAGSRLYGFWGSLTEALQTGQPQSEIKGMGEPMFAKLYAAAPNEEARGNFIDLLEQLTAAYEKAAEEYAGKGYADLAIEEEVLRELVRKADP